MQTGGVYLTTMGRGAGRWFPEDAGCAGGGRASVHVTGSPGGLDRWCQAASKDMGMDRGLDFAPVARTHGLIVTGAGDEVLVYDQERHHIHQLNQVSARVWRCCSGNQSVLEVAVATGLDIDQVTVALRQLAGAGLLEGDLAIPSFPVHGSRRALLKKGGIAVMIPAVVSVTAPLAAQATSPSSRYYKCSNNACADFACSLVCQASNICPGCTKDMSNLICMNFDGPLVPDMCAVYCTCP